MTASARRFVGPGHVRRALGPPGRASTSSAPRSAPGYDHLELARGADLLLVAPGLGQHDRPDGRRPRRRAARLGAPRLRRAGADRPGHEHAHVAPPGDGRQPGAAARRAASRSSSPASGLLADGEVGVGRLADPAEIADAAEARLAGAGSPRRPPRAGERRRHARADRPGALRRQPLQRADGLGGRRGGPPPRAPRSPCSRRTSTCRATRTSATSTPPPPPTCTAPPSRPSPPATCW